MTAFVELPIEVNAEAQIEAIYDDMAAAFPGWEPSAGSVEDFLIRAAVYRLYVPLAELAADVGAEIFQRFGAQIANVAPIEATSATVASTWTMIDNAGYTIPEGTQVDIYTAGDEAVGFRVMEEVQVPAASTATAAGEVILEAVEPGEDGNALSSDARLLDALAFVDSIALVGSSSGGTDAEDPDVYLTRLADMMRTFGPSAVIASDVATLVRGIAGVSRATVLDNFDPATDDPDDPGTWNTEKMTTVATHDVNGAANTAPVQAAIEALLEETREENYVFEVIAPTYSTIKVNFQVTVHPGNDQATVEGAVIAALTEFVSPQNWGRGDQNDPTVWENDLVLRYQDLVTVVNNTQGVNYYTVLKVAKGAAALGTADVTLTGPAALPTPGVIQVGN